MYIPITPNPPPAGWLAGELHTTMQCYVVSTDELTYNIAPHLKQY